LEASLAGSTPVRSTPGYVNVEIPVSRPSYTGSRLPSCRLLFHVGFDPGRGESAGINRHEERDENAPTSKGVAIHGGPESCVGDP